MGRGVIMSNKYLNIAEEVIKVVGKDNILSVTHCATRLRLIVKDHDLINDEEVEKIDEVKGVFYTSGQYQIILGTGNSQLFPKSDRRTL